MRSPNTEARYGANVEAMMSEPGVDIGNDRVSMAVGLISINDTVGDLWMVFQTKLRVFWGKPAWFVLARKRR